MFKNIDEEFNYYVSYLKNYYAKSTSLTIFGMNDDRGFNIHKNILMNLRSYLQDERYNIELIDMCSMFFNKTRHIDYFLKHNLSLEEIRLMQEYGTAIEMNHAIGINVPFMGTLSKAFNKIVLTKTKISKNPKEIKISSKIQETDEPVIIYASGLNDIMYELYINPFDLKQSYMNKYNSPKYDYAYKRVNDKTIKRVIDGHKKNFEAILGLNDEANIFALSAYLYSAMEEEYEKKFKEAILMYNESLGRLCQEYNVTYINCRILENTKYNKPLSNYISKYPPQIIAYEIVKRMYESIVDKRKIENTNFKFDYDDEGVVGVINELNNDILKNEIGYLNSTGYEKEVCLEHIAEHKRELKVFEKIYKKTVNK